MEVLIADDHDSTRSLLRRIIMRDYGCTVVEASNGLEALAAIAAHDFSLVLLDVKMPIVDGIEVLEAIRTSKENADISVVMLSAERDEDRVRRVVELGVTDYLIKPLKTEHISNRLAHALADVSGRRARRAGGHSLKLASDSLVLLADGDPDFRHFFASVLGPKCTVMSAGCGAQAMQMALATPPRAVFLGSGLGALGRNLFLAKAHQIGGLKNTAVVAIAQNDEIEDLRHSGLYEHVVARTFVPESFASQLEPLFSDGAAVDLLARHPGLRTQLIGAVQQVFGMVLSTEVTFGTEAPCRFDRGAIATVGITVQPNEHLTFTMCGSVDAAQRLGAGMTGVNASDVSCNECLAAMQEMANLIAGRLQHSLSERGAAVTCALPEACVGQLPPLPPTDTISLLVDAMPDAWFRVAVADERHQ